MRRRKQASIVSDGSAEKTSEASSFERYRPQLSHFLRKRGHDRDCIEDLVQEAYFRLLRFPPKEVIQRPQAYLYRIAANVANDFLLRRKADPVEFNSERADQAGQHWGEEPAQSDEISQMLHHSLGQMPSAWAAALVMRVRDGRSNAEIAQALGIAPTSVPAYISRALAFCRNKAWQND